MKVFILKVKVLPPINASNRILEQLHGDFALLCTKHGGTVQSPDPSDTTSYERHCVSMTDEDRSLEREVKRLKRKYLFPYILFDLEESKINGITP